MALDGRTGKDDESRGLAIAGLVVSIGAALAFWIIVWLILAGRTSRDGYDALGAFVSAFAVCIAPFVGGGIVALFGAGAGLFRGQRWAFVTVALQLVIVVAAATSIFFLFSAWPVIIAALLVGVSFPIGAFKVQPRTLPPQHLCCACKYDRTGLPPAAVCPECGTAP